MKKLLTTIAIILCISLSGCHNENKINQNNMKTREQLLIEFAKLNADVKVAIEADLAKAKKDLQLMYQDTSVNKIKQ